ncbi:MAG: hypothetical protein GWN84_13970 [Gammaproteobacteria bacterium]|nr:hypothetical protein [Gammaproteobacteria bacterium]NIR83913.1 hypothetical protein [Gammaproteobacteria bacterium]NIU05205.1 hypothetical protein [Gammaproteobacteria bacterium]NIV52061.1 hypothetical protein [Gammaproteobacteria bacterium]NIX86478.1 hypothetical protein [Gammaproteobacteria bacterium]
MLPKEDRPSTCEDGERDEEGRCRFVPWDDLPERDRVRHRQHELRHFCMRAQVPCHDQLWLWGHCDSPKSFPRSDYRAALETAAYLGEVPSEFVRDYALHDLDPDSLAQMVEEARSARSN